MDFISTADTPFPSELNIWYHTLNCGFRTRVSGETDFPCMTDDRVGAGRSYVHLSETLTYDEWCEGVRDGRCYVSDGFGHLMDFTVDDLEVGTRGSEIGLDGPGTVRVTSRVACLLPETPRGESPPDPMRGPFWTPEHARVPGSRDVTVEVVVNGRPVSSTRVPADGVLRDVAFDVRVDRSSWIALRILGSAHTNPVFVLIRWTPYSRVAAQRRLVLERGRSVLVAEITATRRRAVRDQAHVAYEHARGRYRQILSESDVE